jgi:DNA (cytosine-5)-methyltransferase 1
MKILDLFSGIGGFSLGLERAGMQTIAFCEVDPVCRQVLKKHWPNVPIFEDVKTLTAKDIHDTVDVICGGFPCQDISLAGRGAGLAGERSGLWYEYHRLIEEIRPRYVIIENVAALRSRGLDEVLRCLDALGYDAEWHCIPAAAVGAPHRRDRVWIVAHAMRSRSSPRVPAEGHGQEGQSKIADHLSDRFARWEGSRHWATEPDVGRVAHGVPKRVDRLKQLGNAVVPQIPELIGRAILAYENSLD